MAALALPAMSQVVTAAAAALALKSYHSYLNMQPTTDSTDPQPGTPVLSQQYATQKNQRLFVRNDGATVFQGMETSGERMLEGERPIDNAPGYYLDNPQFMRYVARNHANLDKKRFSVDAKDAEAYNATLSKLYQKWLQKQAQTVQKTIQQNLRASVAETVRAASDTLSGRQGYQYNLDNEIKPIIYRKNNNRGRFSPYANPLDDSAFMVPQRGMTFAFPPVTRSGVSAHYHMKANSDSGGYYDPTRAAPSRVEKPGNTYSPVDGVYTKRLRTSPRQFSGVML